LINLLGENLKGQTAEQDVVGAVDLNHKGVKMKKPK